MLNINNDAESAVVASLMQHPELLENIRVTASMFTNLQYQAFVEFVLNNAKVDLKQLFNKASTDKTFVSNERMSTLYNSEFVGFGHFEVYQDEVIHAYQKREAVRLVSEYNEDEGASLQSLVSELQYIELLDRPVEANTKTYVDELIDQLYSERPNNKIKTKFPLLDYKIGGFEPSQLVVIAARPSVGKTAFALNLMWNIALQGYMTTFFSVETTGLNILQRLVASISKIELTKIKEVEELTSDELTQITKIVDNMLHMNVRIEAKSNVTTQDIRKQAMQQTDKPQVIFIDYLQLMQTDARIDRRVAIERISRELKVIANETGAVIVVLSQLNRGVEQRSDKRPMLSDMKESGGIEADASIAMMLYRDDYYNCDVEEADGQSKVECNVAKNKDGETGVVDFQFYKKIQRFYT